MNYNYLYKIYIIGGIVDKIFTIDKIIAEGLCTGCGTCKGICPQSAIDIRTNKSGTYLPLIIIDKCIKCGNCYRSCSGKYFDYDEFNHEIFGKTPKNAFLGNFNDCYISYANNQQIRYNSASGGVITALLIYCLENEIINGAVVTKMKKDNPLEPEPFIARTKEEIINASKSKYCPISVNSIIKEILKSNEEEKFAVVGLPCHINGFRKAEKYYPKLKKKIKYHFGIICSHTNNFNGTKFLIKKLEIDNEDINRLDYRGDGWPGKMKIWLKDGNKKTIELTSPLYACFHNSGLFTPSRCLICDDVTAEFSDISFGDAWLKDTMKIEHFGKSLIISRSESGEELLKAAALNGQIDLSKIDEKYAIISQKMYIYIKKINISDRVLLRRLFNRQNPELDLIDTKSNTYSILIALNLFFISFFGTRFAGLVNIIPLRILLLYMSLLYNLYSSELGTKMKEEDDRFDSQ